MSSTWTLWTLPAQPSPKSDVASSVPVTIWAFSCLGFAYLFHRKLSGETPVWPEFKSIRGSAILLAVWYTATATDRWLHYEQRVLPYGYILFEPVLEIVRVISTIWFLWGTYKVVWNELERRFKEESSQGAWWLAAKISIFIVGLVSFYYVVLRIAMAVVWLQFLTLNIIADVATKCYDFELAMTAFFTVFGILTVIAAVATIFFRAKKREGSWAKTRIYLVLATVMLLFRSLAECILVSMVHSGLLLRHNTQISYDIAYGLLTSLYLLFMYLQTRQLTSKLDTGNSDADNVRSDVRAWILDRLSEVTNHHKAVAPPFSSLLDEASNELSSILEQGPLSLTSCLTPDRKLQIANGYINQLRGRFSHLAPQPKTMPVQSQPPKRPAGAFAPLGGRQSAPPSSGLYESLRNNSESHLRKLSSVPNMRGNRFAPRGMHDAAAPGVWQPNIAPIEERQPTVQATAAYPTPFHKGNRTEAAASLGGGQRSVSDPAVLPGEHQQRRRFGPQMDNPVPIREAGHARFVAQPAAPHAAYPPDSYAPRPQDYPAQSYSPQPVPPQDYNYNSQYHIPQVDSSTTVGAYSDSSSPSRPVEADYPLPPTTSTTQPQQRRRFDPSRNSSSLALVPPLAQSGGVVVPDVTSSIPRAAAESSQAAQQRYQHREFYPPAGGSPPIPLAQTNYQASAGELPPPLMSQFGTRPLGPGPRPFAAYAETVTSSDEASTRSPVNFNYALPDLGGPTGQENGAR